MNNKSEIFKNSFKNSIENCSKKAIVKLSLGLGVLIFAFGANAEMPKVTCEVQYNVTDASGTTVDLFRLGTVLVNTQELETKFRGFVLETKIDEICTADNDRCGEAYELQVSFKKGGSESSIMAPVSTANSGQRFSASLAVDRENVLAICTVK